MLLGNYFLLFPFGAVLINKKSIRINTTVIILFAFVTAYIIPELVSSVTPEYRLLFIVIAFLIGYNYYLQVTENDIISSYLVVAIGMSVHIAVNFILSFIKAGGIKFSPTYIDFWSGELTTTTGMMSNFVLFLPLFVFALSKKGKYYLYLPFVLIGLMFGIMTGNRTTLILFAISTIMGIVVLLVYRQIRLGFVAIFVVVSLIVFVLLAYNFNWFGLQKMFDTSYMSYRLNLFSEKNESVLETQRWDTKWEYIKRMLDYPWGGGKLRDSVGSYAHDIWLDTWSSGGVAAFLLLTFYIASFIYRMIKFVRITRDVSAKILFSSYLVITLTQFLVEPIIQGAPWLFISACLFDGFVSRYIVNEKNKRLTLCS